MTMENPRYFLLNMGISQCHASFHSGVYFWLKLRKCHVLPGDSKDKITSVIIASQWPKLVICMTRDYQTQIKSAGMMCRPYLSNGNFQGFRSEIIVEPP